MEIYQFYSSSIEEARELTKSKLFQLLLKRQNYCLEQGIRQLQTKCSVNHCSKSCDPDYAIDCYDCSIRNSPNCLICGECTTEKLPQSTFYFFCDLSALACKDCISRYKDTGRKKLNKLITESEEDIDDENLYIESS
jgi:hypothetical protein